MQHPNSPQQLQPELPPSLLDTIQVNPVQFAQAVAGFFERAHITGADVPAYSEVMMIVNHVAQGHLRFIDVEQQSAIRALETRLRELEDERDQLMMAYHQCPAVKASVQQFHQRKAKSEPPYRSIPDADPHQQEAAAAAAGIPAGASV